MRNPKPARHRHAVFRALAVANALRRRKEGQTITVQLLADEYEVCYKTIHRDLDWLRDIGMPIFWCNDCQSFIWRSGIALPWWVGGDREGTMPHC